MAGIRSAAGFASRGPVHSARGARRTVTCSIFVPGPGSGVAACFGGAVRMTCPQEGRELQ